MLSFMYIVGVHYIIPLKVLQARHQLKWALPFFMIHVQRTCRYARVGIGMALMSLYMCVHGWIDFVCESDLITYLLGCIRVEEHELEFPAVRVFQLFHSYHGSPPNTTSVGHH